MGAARAAKGSGCVKCSRGEWCVVQVIACLLLLNPSKFQGLLVEQLVSGWQVVLAGKAFSAK